MTVKALWARLAGWVIFAGLLAVLVYGTNAEKLVYVLFIVAHVVGYAEGRAVERLEHELDDS